MSYRLTCARNVGKSARKAATADFRALLTFPACDAGRIGRTDAKLSSLASICAISRSISSAFFGPHTRMNAHIDTRQSTSSGLGSGKSSLTEGGAPSCTANIELFPEQVLRPSGKFNCQEYDARHATARRRLGLGGVSGCFARVNARADALRQIASPYLRVDSFGCNKLGREPGKQHLGGV